VAFAIFSVLKVQ